MITRLAFDEAGNESSQHFRYKVHFLKTLFHFIAYLS